MYERIGGWALGGWVVSSLLGVVQSWDRLNGIELIVAAAIFLAGIFVGNPLIASAVMIFGNVIFRESDGALGPVPKYSKLRWISAGIAFLLADSVYRILA